MSPAPNRRLLAVLALLATFVIVPARADAEPRAVARHDGVYDRFDGDLDLGLALGAELGSVGQAAPALRASAHYFSIAGVYFGGRVKAGDESAPSLFALGVDLRPLFVPRWAKGYETGPGLLDLTLDSLSLSLGAFWSGRRTPGTAPGSAGASPGMFGAPPGQHRSERGFEAGLGFGVPLLARASGPWLEARALLRYPDAEEREEAVLIALAWHGFVTTPFSSGSRL